MSISARQYNSWARRNFPAPWDGHVLSSYTTESFTPFFAASQAVGDLVVRCPTRRAARVLTADRGRRVYLYSFDHAPVSYKLTDGGPCAPGAQGAFHGSEIPFVFHVADFMMTPPESRLADAAWRYWRNFAWSGDPNQGPPWAAADPKDAALVTWPRFDNSSEANLVLGTPPDGYLHNQTKHGDPTYRPHCGLWDDYHKSGEPPPSEDAPPAPQPPAGDGWEERRRALWIGRRRASFELQRSDDE